MHEPQQLHLLPGPEDDQRKRCVEYVPPDIDTIREYAHKVCRRLSETEVKDSSSTDYERGLTNFMQVVVRIETRHRNQGVKNGQ